MAQGWLLNVPDERPIEENEHRRRIAGHCNCHFSRPRPAPRSAASSRLHDETFMPADVWACTVCVDEPCPSPISGAPWRQ